jgi:tetratricopeptide (TPR) repeat protein
VTYPDATVSELLNTHFVPVQLDLSKEPKLADRYQVIWTPNLNIVDYRERVAFHLEGWLSPSEFAAMLYIGLGHYALKRKRYDNAITHFKTVYDHYPQSEFGPEALYYLAVGKYMSSHDVEQLLQGWRDLRRRYSSSAWAMRTRVG